MSGHTHMNSPGLTQNQGNILGDRPCVRQSRLYREGCGGNAMKELLGQDSLKWDTTQTQGAYQGGRVYDHNTSDGMAAVGDGANKNNAHNASGSQQQQQQQSNYNESVQGGMRVYTPKRGGGSAEYQVVSMDDDEDTPAPPHHQQQQQQRQPSSMQTTSGAYGSGQVSGGQQQQQQQLGEEGGRSVTGRGFRPGCGQANRQTYNIFTGQ